MNLTNLKDNSSKHFCIYVYFSYIFFQVFKFEIFISFPNQQQEIYQLEKVASSSYRDNQTEINKKLFLKSVLFVLLADIKKETQKRLFIYFDRQTCTLSKKFTVFMRYQSKWLSSKSFSNFDFFLFKRKNGKIVWKHGLRPFYALILETKLYQNKVDQIRIYGRFLDFRGNLGNFQEKPARKT